MIPTLTHYSDRISDIPFGSNYGIYIYIYKYCDILSGILSGIYSEILSNMLSGIFGISIWHLLNHSFWHILASILTFWTGGARIQSPELESPGEWSRMVQVWGASIRSWRYGWLKKKRSMHRYVQIQKRWCPSSSSRSVGAFITPMSLWFLLVIYRTGIYGVYKPINITFGGTTLWDLTWQVGKKMEKVSWTSYDQSQMLHVWYIYLHLGDF